MMKPPLAWNVPSSRLHGVACWQGVRLLYWAEKVGHNGYLFSFDQALIFLVI